MRTVAAIFGVIAAAGLLAVSMLMNLRFGLTLGRADLDKAAFAGAVSADVVLNALSRADQPPEPEPVATPAALRLTHAPVENCARYDGLRALRKEARCGAA